MTSCDPDTGVCRVADNGASASLIQQPPSQRLTLHYIGDPMCSWCWGIAPAVEEAATWCLAHGIGFEITVGGLRAGGGQPWNEAFKIFLRREWMRIASVTGQPFGYTLLDLPRFHYDTEPACRAIVCVQQMVAEQADGALIQEAHARQPSNDQDPSPSAASKAVMPAPSVFKSAMSPPAGSGHLQAPATDKLLPLRFMAAVQRKFYVEGQDPKLPAFYGDICQQLGLSFERFSALFNADEARQATWQAIERCRSWGVDAFPTLLIEEDGHLQTLSQGYTTAERIIEALSAFNHSDESPE